jgi:hypothetical protein
MHQTRKGELPKGLTILRLWWIRVINARVDSFRGMDTMLDVLDITITDL